MERRVRLEFTEGASSPRLQLHITSCPSSSKVLAWTIFLFNLFIQGCTASLPAAKRELQGGAVVTDKPTVGWSIHANLTENVVGSVKRYTIRNNVPILFAGHIGQVTMLPVDPYGLSLWKRMPSENPACNIAAACQRPEEAFNSNVQRWFGHVRDGQNFVDVRIR